MPNIFEDNPNAYNFIITNNAQEHFNLSEGCVNIPPGASGNLQQFSIDFCLFKYKYTYFPAVKSWFDQGLLTAVPINGSAPVVCSWQASSSGGGSGSGNVDDFGRLRVTSTDVVADYLANKVSVDPATIDKTINNIAGDEKLVLAGKVKTFTDLTDTPSSLAGASSKALTVNSSSDRLVLTKWRDSFSFGPLLTWPVDHTFGYEPLFSITDINGEPRLFVPHLHVNVNRLEIYWAEPTAGTIRLR